MRIIDYTCVEVPLVKVKIKVYCHNDELIKECQRLALDFNLKGTHKSERVVSFVILEEKTWVIKQLIDNPNLIEDIIHKQFISEIKISTFDYLSKLDIFATKCGAQQIFISSFSKNLILRLAVTLYFIATYNSLEHDELIIHGCGVDSGKCGLLFLGEGGAGKSTIANLSLQVGKEVLSDDLICINCVDLPTLISAPGIAKTISSFLITNPPLKAIFNIKKDDRDCLIMLKKPAIAQVLFASFYSNPWASFLPKETTEKVLDLASDLVRNILGFELHFRKSPDFWKLIDSQFPKIDE